MNYYTVPMVGTGAHDDPYRPDIPDGTPFVGECGNDNTFLITTPVDLGADTTARKKQLPRQALEATANARGLQYNDVMKWLV